MALERKLLAVPPQTFTSSGTNVGTFEVERADLFKEKQCVFLQANAVATIELEIKRIVGTVITVGPRDNDPDSRTNISAYTTGAGAVVFSNEQVRPLLHDVKTPSDKTLPLGAEDVDRVTYDEPPSVARRVVIVDSFGERIGSVESAGVRRLAVDAAGVSINVSGISISGLNQAPRTPSVSNVAVATSGVETSFVLPDETQKFTVRVRGMDSNMRLAFSSGDTVSGPYLTIRRGVSFFEDNVNTDAVTLYFQTDKSSQVVEILTWA